uniref:Uncharacterized protein n=1 Tax=Tanacetum cinerariifolium TaxID=118510 RepID=A0A699TZN6_TANCI|nr:hypothetical protein [Tanacetum cinerariifolium]
MTIVKRVIVKQASEFTARINTLRLPSALPKKMDGKQKKQPRIRFASISSIRVYRMSLVIFVTSTLVTSMLHIQIISV